MGVSRLPLFLKSSKRLYCLFDYDWCSRLWCVFELAIYLKLRKNPKIVFFSISQILFMMACVAVTSTFVLLYLIFENAFGDQDSASKFLAWYWFCTEVIVIVIIFLLAQQHFLARLQLGKKIRNFDVKNTQITVPEDRLLLLTYIKELFKPAPGAVDARSSEVQSPRSQRAVGSGVSNPGSSFGIRSTVTGLRSKRGFMDDAEGIQEFNRYVRTEVLERLPPHGFKSWTVFWYPAAVIALALHNKHLQNYDIWAFDFDNPQFASAGMGFRTILAFCFDIFVFWPVATYQLAAIVRFFLWVQSWTKLRYWLQVAIFLPIFVVEEQILSLRMQLLMVLRQLTTSGCIQGNVLGAPVLKYMIFYNPLFGIRDLLNADAVPKTHVAFIEAHWWVNALLWIFLVVPLTIFCWIIYEPQWSMQLRRKAWKRMFGTGATSSRRADAAAVPPKNLSFAAPKRPPPRPSRTGTITDSSEQ